MGLKYCNDIKKKQKKLWEKFERETVWMRVFKTAINTRKDMHIVVFIKSAENPIKQIHLHLFLRIDDCDTSLSLSLPYMWNFWILEIENSIKPDFVGKIMLL